MSLTNPNLPVTEARLQEFYERIKPYLGGGYSAGDGIDISNGEISTDNLQSGDMDDIVTPLPSIPARLHKYSTEEQIVGEWIDGKPLYQKTIVDTINNTNNAWATFATISGITCREFKGYFKVYGETQYIPIFFSTSSSSLNVQQSGDDIQYTTSNSYWINNNTLYLTILYTKNAD